MNGYRFFLVGIQLIAKPKLRRFVYIPIIINTLLFILIWGVSKHFFSELTTWIDHYLPSWLQWLNILFWLAYILLGLLMTAYLFTWLANLIAAPLYGLLSESVQRYLTDKPLPETSWSEVMADIPKALAREWQKLMYYLPRAIGLFILTLIPGVNLIATILWFLFGAWMQSLQYVDYPLDNNRQSFSQVKQWLSSHKMQSFGFGGCIMIAMMIPFINIIAMPAAVAGATAMTLPRISKNG